MFCYFSANEYLFIAPNRYVFPGAEVFDRDDDDESDISSNNSGSDTDSDDEADSSDAPAAGGGASGAPPMRPVNALADNAAELTKQNENTENLWF